MMRIITGRARGSKLFTLEGSNTRPTSERTKEAVFSILNLNYEGKSVLDLFAGSGQMGLEAVSRGAEKAIFVDSSKDAVEVIKKNISKTHFEKECTAVLSSYTDFLKRVCGRERYSLVFLDPPYASDFLENSLKLLTKYELLSDNAVLVCESDKPELDFDEDRFEIKAQKKYGIAHITILKLKEKD